MRNLTRSLTTPSLKDALASAARKARAQADRDGILLPDRPGERMPPLPEDVTSLDERDLMTLYSQMVAWKEYAEGQLAVASIDERLADEELADRRNQAIIAGKGKTATAQKAATADDPRVTEARTHASHCYAVRKLTESVYNAAEGRMRFLSRELTRRTGIADQVRRHGRWAA